MSELLSQRIAMMTKSSDEVRVMPISLTSALERASAATFYLPMICRMSVMNSAMNNNCLLWLGLHELPNPEVEKVKGLWSV